MSDWLEDLDEVFEAFLGGLDLGTKLIKKWNDFKKEYQKTVIATNDDIKGTDETNSARPSPPKEESERKASAVELERCSDGVYRPKRSKLDQK